MTTLCPKGHASSEADFCSECGARIGAPTLAQASATNAGNSAANIASDICPDCATPRSPGGRFCEVCQYDFANNTSRGVTQVNTVSATSTAVSTVPAPEVPAATAAASSLPAVPVSTTAAVDAIPTDLTPADTSWIRLKAVVKVDPSLAADTDAVATVPVGKADRQFPLDLDENLLGRRSESKKIYPEIEVSDPGVSHRHCQLVKQSNGSFAVLDLGSANGTRLNGHELEPGVAAPLKAGDEIVVGMWTRILIQARS